MTEWKKITYAYKTIEPWQQYDKQVQDIIKEDLSMDDWVSTRNLPPIGYSPPLTTESIQSIKNLNKNIVVNEPADE